MPVMPVRDLLVGMTGAHEKRFLEMAAHKLKGERQALRSEASWQGDCRATGHVEGRSEADKSRKTFCRGEELLFLRDGEIGVRLCRDQQEIDVRKQSGEVARKGKALVMRLHDLHAGSSAACFNEISKAAIFGRARRISRLMCDSGFWSADGSPSGRYHHPTGVWQRYLFDGCAQGFEDLSGFTHRRHSLGIATCLIVRGVYPNTDRANTCIEFGKIIRDGRDQRRGIFTVSAGDHAKHGAGVGRGARHRSDMIQALGESKDAVAADPTPRWLEASDAVGCARKSNRPARITP